MPAAPGAPDPLPTGRRRPVLVLVGASVAVVAVVIVAFLVADRVTSAIAVGSGTATVSWVPVPSDPNLAGNPPQRFTGTIGSAPLRGVATTPVTTAAADPFRAGSSTTSVEIFRYTGTFDGRPFRLGVSVVGPIALSASGSTTLHVDGTWNGQAVHGVVTAPNDPNRPSPAIPFSGTIGSRKVTGALHCCTGTRTRQTASATYTVHL